MYLQHRSGIVGPRRFTDEFLCFMAMANPRVNSKPRPSGHAIKRSTEADEVWKGMRRDPLQALPVFSASGGQVVVLEVVLEDVLEVVVVKQELGDSSSQHCAFVQKRCKTLTKHSRVLWVHRLRQGSGPAWYFQTGVSSKDKKAKVKSYGVARY